MASIEKNKELIEKYPWLLPHNRWTDKVDEKYDYSYTELDAMPDGWLNAFGEDMCEEIQQALNELGEQANTFRIMQIKEKYGSLRFYTNWNTSKISNIIHKYEQISRYTCIKCGAPATRVTTDWISPWCDECAKKFFDDTVDINEFYNDDEF